MLAPTPKSVRSAPWYSAPSLPGRRAFWLGFAALAGWVLLCLTSAGDWLTRWETKFDFQLRQAVGLAPRIHPKLKIFSIDQQTMGFAEMDNVPLVTWTTLFRAMGETKPRAILTDGLFALFPAANAKAVETFESDRLYGPPLYGGMAWSQTEREGRPRLPSDCCGFEASSWLAPGERLEAKTAPPMRNGFLYGPSAPLLDSFQRLGHLGVREDGSLDLVLRPSSETLVPHWSIQFAEPLQWNGGKLVAAGKEIPQDDNGHTMPSYPKPEAMAASLSSLAPLLQKALKKEPLPGLSEGDTILLLNQAFPGDVLTVDSPVGKVPAIYASIAMVNDTLVGKWIRPARLSWLWIGLACAVGAWLGYSYGPFLFVATQTAAMGLIALTGLLTFFFLGRLSPWLPSALGCGLCGTVLFVVKIRAERRLARHLNASLKGMIAPDALKGILADPTTLDVTPSSQLVTVVHLDVVGFSLGVERDSPEQAFRFWKEERGILTPIVHQHGGVILKANGDGCIALFGYQFRKETKPDPNHAEAAIRCALDIQRSKLTQNERHFAQGLPLYPLRIGVHTDRVFVGDAGTDGRIELTLLGNGVHFAQKLMAACEPYRIQLGSSTRDRLTTLAHEMKGLHKRFLRLAEQDELLDAYEIDPFHETPGRLEQGLDQFRKRAALTRLESRWPVEAEGWIFAETQWGKGEIVNFSRGGLALRFPQYFGAGVSFQLRLDSGNGKLAEACREMGLPTVTAEVRWGKPDKDAYLHGLAFKNLTPEQREQLFNAIHTLHLGQPIPKAA